MSSTLQDAFELPVVETIRGEKITFPLLEIDDYLPWITALHDEQKKYDAQMIQLNKDPLQRIEMKRRSEQNVPGFDRIFARIYQLDGAKKVLEMSLKKSGKSDEEIAAIIKKIRPSRLTRLAFEVSALEDPRPAETEVEANADPNVVAAEPAVA